MDNETHRNLPVRCDDGGSQLVDCSLHTHDSCDADSCEIKQTLSRINEAKIRTSVITGIAGIAISSVYAAALISVWWYHAIHGHLMPDVPWYVTAVALVPFGSSIWLKVPKND